LFVENKGEIVGQRRLKIKSLLVKEKIIFYKKKYFYTKIKECVN